MYYIRLSIVLSFFAGSVAFCMDQSQQKQGEEKPAYELTAHDLDVNSSQNKAIKDAFAQAIHIAGLQRLILEYYGPEWYFYKKLSTQSWSDSMSFLSGYPPIRLLRFNNANTQLTAYLDHSFMLHGTKDCCKNSKKIVWDVASGAYTTNSPMLSTMLPWGWHHTDLAQTTCSEKTEGPIIVGTRTNYNRAVIIIGESADGSLRAHVTNPNLSSAFVANPHVITVEGNKQFLLKKILGLDGEAQATASTATAAASSATSTKSIGSVGTQK